MLRVADVQHIQAKYQFLEGYFVDNSKRKNYFLATCYHINDRADLEFINTKCPYGGIIGINNSRLDSLFGFSKIFRLHAVLHDASGFMKSCYRIGPGYSYIIPCKISSCYLGHPTGLLFCLYLKLFQKSLYNQLEC